MPGSDCDEILRLLGEGDEALRVALRGISEKDARQQPADGDWSVLECLEHVAASETFLAGKLKESVVHENPPVARERVEKFRHIAADRARKIEAPEMVMPRGESGAVEAAMVLFAAARRETRLWLEGFSGDLRCAITTHPMITGPVNCYEILILMALHPRRHAEQIGIIRARLNSQAGYSSH